LIWSGIDENLQNQPALRQIRDNTIQKVPSTTLAGEETKVSIFGVFAALLKGVLLFPIYRFSLPEHADVQAGIIAQKSIL